MSVTFNNTVFGAAQATTGANVFGTFTGANVLSGATPVTINGTINNPGSLVSVSLNVGGVVTTGAQGSYLGYSQVAGGNYVYYFAVSGAGLTTPVTIGVTGAASLPLLSVATPITTTNVTAPVGPNSPCYVEGTLVRTVRGDVAVEDLAIGDEVVTASGAHRPIVWLGHRRTDCARHPEPRLVQPIRITAGAVAPGMPSRDLLVSPDHALFFDDVLVQARFLVNGTTIVRDTPDAVTYWHVELETHDILIAENMPSESYLDVGNRWAFADTGTVTALRPQFVEEAGEGHCAPLVAEGERLVAIRQWLADRARHLGVRTTADPALQLLADGMVLTPAAVVEGRFVYAVPAGVATLRLVSRGAVPAEMTADQPDARRLGLCVTGLQLDGVAIDLADAMLADGWHDAEPGLRWTDGDAAIPPARAIVLTAHGYGSYPVAAPLLCSRSAGALAVAPLKMAG